MQVHVRTFNTITVRVFTRGGRPEGPIVSALITEPLTGTTTVVRRDDLYALVDLVACADPDEWARRFPDQFPDQGHELVHDIDHAPTALHAPHTDADTDQRAAYQFKRDPKTGRVLHHHPPRPRPRT